MFLMLEGPDGPVRIPVAYDEDSEVGQDLVGDPGDFAPNGDHCTTVRARCLRIPITSRPLTRAAAAEIQAVLEGPIPIPCGGDYVELLGRSSAGFQVIPGPASWQHVSLAAGRHLILRVELHEAIVPFLGGEIG